jgi:hypothetical protein
MAKLERKDQRKRQKPNQGAGIQRQSQLGGQVRAARQAIGRK